jgi:hypothetical protein
MNIPAILEHINAVPLRILQLVHSIEMIVVGISMKEGEWYKKYIPIFIMKYNYFLINNIFLPKEMALNVATYYDFIAILLVMLWIKPVHKILASVLKTSTRSTLLFRAGFYTLFAMCRFQSINSALERYTGDIVSSDFRI